MLKFELEEGNRQMMLLAIAELALSRPGWDDALGHIAETLSAAEPGAVADGRQIFEAFKRTNADRVKAERIPIWLGPLIAQSDDSELLEWLVNAREKGGGFVAALADAALVADWENYPILRPVLLDMRKKYPQYEASDAVKAELKEHGRHSALVTSAVDELMFNRNAEKGESGS
jgi:hypothetical protein